MRFFASSRVSRIVNATFFMALPDQRNDDGEGVENDADKIVRENNQVCRGNCEKVEVALAARCIV